MAILKNLKTPHGVDASYHKLTNVSINVNKDLMEMSFAIFATAEARDSGAIPLWNEQITFKLSEMQPSPLDMLYPVAMQADYFADATSDTPATVDLIRVVKPAVEELVDSNAIARAEALARPKLITGAK